MSIAPRPARTLLLSTLLAGLCGLGCQNEKVHTSAPARYPATRPLRSDTELTDDYVCQIRSIQHIEVRALERGYLQDVLVDEGKSVEEGQTLFQITPTLYQAELEKAQAEAEFARIEYENTKLLTQRAVVSENELALAKAKLDKALAEVQLSHVHRDFTEVRAPFAGIVDRLQVRRGSLLEEGELLTTLSDNSAMWVYFNVTESEYLDFQSRASSGAPLVVPLVMANGTRFPLEGRVETIEADFHNETGTIAFRATFPNPDGLLRHGQTGKILMSKALDDALLVPQKATFEVLDRRYVFVVDDAGTVHAREIQVAHELPHLFVVEEGLEEGDTFLLDGLRQVKDGDTIVVNLLEPGDVVAGLEVPAE